MNMTLVLLYETRVEPKDVEELNRLREAFSKIYERHNVKVLGQWRDHEKPHHTFYMSEYSDESDYESTIERLHSDEEYIRLSAQLNAIRTASSVTRLQPIQ